MRGGGVSGTRVESCVFNIVPEVWEGELELLQSLVAGYVASGCTTLALRGRTGRFFTMILAAKVRGTDLLLSLAHRQTSTRGEERYSN